jgi:hypothetical protein
MSKPKVMSTKKKYMAVMAAGREQGAERRERAESRERKQKERERREGNLHRTTSSIKEHLMWHLITTLLTSQHSLIKCIAEHKKPELFSGKWM